MSFGPETEPLKEDTDTAWKRRRVKLHVLVDPGQAGPWRPDGNSSGVVVLLPKQVPALASGRAIGEHSL